MRVILIALQAGALTVFAVVGAYGESHPQQSCPLPQAKTSITCQE